ncbi:MAG: M48 family metallopeptidase [Verrucomicrobiota bacterium]
MDFFEQQDVARRKSGVLVVYFVLALIGIVASIYAVVVVGTGMMGVYSSPGDVGEPGGLVRWWQPELLAGTAFGTLLVVFLGSGFKTMQLSAGGKVVATDLGGRRVDANTTDVYERRLINIVEEMAIASGLPTPDVYVMEEEESINAFAAGRTPSDAVVGVTRGCMKLLSRDELQGVVAHEFSHILNGDMRLNLRLLGLLHGILIVSIIGRIVLRGGAHSREKGAAPILLMGLAIFLIGLAGVFFGKLIKAAVSRQREYLADASAVQFTRNPDGIGGALQKIGGLSYGSHIENPRAEEASHMFFANGMRAGLASAFATHPPLMDRIRRLLPSWDGRFPKVAMPKISAGWEGAEAQGKGEAARRRPARRERQEQARGFSMPQATAVLGNLTADQVEVGREIMEGLPEAWLQVVHHESSAQAMVFALLLAQDDALRGQELGYLREATDEETYAETVRLHGELGDLHSSRKLALIDLAIPTLRRLTGEEYLRFSEILKRLMESDGMIDLFEFTLQKIVRRHLDMYFRRQPPPRVRYRQLGQLADEASVLLTTMAFLGNPNDEATAQAAFWEGAKELEASMGGGGMSVRAARECGLKNIDAALDRFDEATPLMKKRLLYACARTAMMDGELKSDEAELIRAIADTIGVPVPPFVTGGG